MRTQPKGPTTEGGRLLFEIIRASGMSIPVWAEHHGIDRLRVQKVINGDVTKRIGVDFAVAVERATNGAVKPEMFLRDTVAAPDPAASSTSLPAADDPRDATGTEG